MEVNAIYEGDNLEILSKFPDKSVDLVYADPPFFTNKYYEVIWHDGAEKRAYEDRWLGGIEHYISWMEPRIRECQRILKDTGSMYLHCDWHANYKLREIMGNIFGENNFRNEIIWKRHVMVSSVKGGKINSFSQKTDTILFFSKTKKNTFNVQYEKLDDASQRFNNVEIETGRRFETQPLILDGNEPRKLKFPIKTIVLPSGKRFAWNQSTLDARLKKNPYCVYWTVNGIPRQKKYEDEFVGQPISNIWTDITVITSSSKERLGYPTQKPLALLERIINASSNRGEIILDPFCGCGTTIVASQKLKRRWIGIDISPTACKLMQKRLRIALSANAQIIRGKVDLKYVRKLHPFEFQNWVVVDKFLGKVSDRKSGDMGIDGWTPQITGGYPIQVKQSDGVGREVVDKFQPAMNRVKKKKGYIVAFSFSKGAYEEVARVKNHEGLEIILRTVSDLLEGKTE